VTGVVGLSVPAVVVKATCCPAMGEPAALVTVAVMLASPPPAGRLDGVAVRATVRTVLVGAVGLLRLASFLVHAAVAAIRTRVAIERGRNFTGFSW
jgi:hypothetical protein